MTKARRKTGWEKALASYLSEASERPFEWGAHDCCRFACAGLDAQGLADPMAAVRVYKTARGAAGAISRLGGTLDAAASRLAEAAGWPEIPPAFAGRGCPVLADAETPDGTIEPVLGLVDLDGRQAVFADFRKGLRRAPLATCRRAWRLP